MPTTIAWCSQETIAMSIGIKRETVCKAIKRLRVRRYLERYRKHATRGWFRNCISSCFQSASPLHQMPGLKI
jgi:DNA-binding MarR family transcriptional regulator